MTDDAEPRAETHAEVAELARHLDRRARWIVAEQRRNLADLMDAVALALAVAAGLVLVGMTLLWFDSSTRPAFRDWPGRYWLAVISLLGASAVLFFRAGSVRGEGSGDPVGPTSRLTRRHGG